MKTKSSLKGWSRVVVLVVLVLAGGIGLRHLAAANAAPMLVATGAPVPLPPVPWSR